MKISRIKLKDAQVKVQSLLDKYKEIDSMLETNDWQITIIIASFTDFVKSLNNILILSDNNIIDITDNTMIETTGNILESYDVTIEALDDAIADYKAEG